MPKLILQVKTQNHIACYDALPISGGKKQFLTPSQLNEKFGITYSESFYAENDAVKQKLSTTPFKPIIGINYPNYVKQLTTLLETPCELLSLAYINDQVGHCVIAEEDIPEETVLGIYSGILTEPDTQNSDDYALSITDDLVVSAKQVRGLSGFMQHLPTDHRKDVDAFFKKTGIKLNPTHTEDTELIDIEVSDKAPQGCLAHLAYGNVTHQLLPFNGSYVRVIVTKHPIQKHGIVGHSYGKSFWESLGRKPELFNQFGQIIPHFYYKFTNDIQYTVEIKGVKRTFKLYCAARQAFIELISQNALFNPGKDKDMSLYDVRNALVDVNVFGTAYAALENNAAASLIEKKFSNKKNPPTISLFWQKPDKVEKGSTDDNDYAIDLVCRAKDDQSYRHFLSFFAPFGNKIRTLPNSFEVVLPHVNSPETSKQLLELL